MKALFALFAVIFTFSSPVQAQDPDPCIDYIVNSLAEVESLATSDWSVSKTCDGSGGNYFMRVSWDDGCIPIPQVSTCLSKPYVEAFVDVKAGTCQGTYAPLGSPAGGEGYDGYSGGQARQLKTDLKTICNEVVDVPACP